MVSWSALASRASLSHCRRVALNSRHVVKECKGLYLVPVRTSKSEGHRFNISSSAFTWNKYKDMLYFYLTILLTPALAVIMYCNIFIGPATLKTIPEGYEPKHWEYHPHPITRFIARYILESPQKEYEKMLFALFTNEEERLANETGKLVKYHIADRRDFQAWYYAKPNVKYQRLAAMRKLENETFDEKP